MLKGKDVIGNERSFAATADLETPSKQLLFDICHKHGYEWFEKQDRISFHFPELATNTAINYAMENVGDSEKIKLTEMFGFMSGIFDALTERKDRIETEE